MEARVLCYEFYSLVADSSNVAKFDLIREKWSSFGRQKMERKRACVAKLRQKSTFVKRTGIGRVRKRAYKLMLSLEETQSGNTRRHRV